MSQEKTLSKQFKVLYKQDDFLNLSDNGSKLGDVICVDAVKIDKSIHAFIARNSTKVVFWKYYHTESFESWFDFLSKLSFPKAIVCDGQKGLIKAIYACFKDKIIIQRCIAHICFYTRARLSLKPKTQAGKEIFSLVFDLKNVKTHKQKQDWIQKLNRWLVKYGEFLKEKRYSEKR